MSRDIPAGLETEIEQPVVNPFLAFRLETPDPVYCFTGVGTIVFSDTEGTSHDWLGAGDLGALEQVGESTDGTAQGLRAALYRIPAEFRSDIKDQARRGDKMEVYFGALNETYQEVEGTVLLNRYRLDQYKITDGGDTISVEVTGESRAIDARKPAVKRFTDETQQRKHPGDKFFEFVSRMTEISILWQKAEDSIPSIGGATAGLGGFVQGGAVNV